HRELTVDLEPRGALSRGIEALVLGVGVAREGCEGAVVAPARQASGANIVARGQRRLCVEEARTLIRTRAREDGAATSARARGLARERAGIREATLLVADFGLDTGG